MFKMIILLGFMIYEQSEKQQSFDSCQIFTNKPSVLFIEKCTLSVICMGVNFICT